MQPDEELVLPGTKWLLCSRIFAIDILTPSTMFKLSMVMAVVTVTSPKNITKNYSMAEISNGKN